MERNKLSEDKMIKTQSKEWEIRGLGHLVAYGSVLNTIRETTRSLVKRSVQLRVAKGEPSVWDHSIKNAVKGSTQWGING